MKINGKSIPGVFPYDTSYSYENGDMVVYNRAIYVYEFKKDEGNLPESPDESENFYLYLCDRFETVEGYLDTLDKGEDLDIKACSVSTLQAIMNHFMVGIDSKGIIGKEVVEDNTGGFVTNIGELDYGFNPLTVINDILTSNIINNGIFKVSSNLPELRNYGFLSSVVILKQYTTYNDSTKVRVQEIVDPVAELLFLRSYTVSSSGQSSEIKPFKCTIAKSKKIVEMFNHVIQVYNDRLNVFMELENNLKGNFRYRHISLDNTIDLTLNAKEDINNSEFITLLLKKESGNSTTTENITIKLSDVNPDDTYPKFGIFGGTAYLIVSKTSSGYYFRIEGSNNIYFIDVTYRDSYGN